MYFCFHKKEIINKYAGLFCSSSHSYSASQGSKPRKEAKKRLSELWIIIISSRGSRSSGSRGFSSGSVFGFRGRRARDSDTLDVEVNELENLHSSSHEVDASGKWDLGFVKLTGAAAEAAAKEGKPLAYDGLHDLRQMLIPPSPQRCNYINNTIQEFVNKVGEEYYEYREHHEYLRAYYCGLNKGD